MGEKDYLKELSKSVEKPESFKEEKVEYLSKKPFDFKKVGIIAVVLVIVGIVAYMLFFAPKIVMLDFVGKDKTELSNWIKLEGLETSTIVVNEEYNFDYGQDVITYQSIEPQTKIKKDVKLSVTVSKGADPDEKIVFPDIESMTSTEIADWVKTNKLTNVKTTTLYSNTISEGNVISFDLGDVVAEAFTRSTSLSIVVSKGAAPAKTITLEDFANQTKAYVDAYASKNNIDIKYVQQYSDDVEAGLVISQSIAANATIKENETLTITISNGKAVFMDNFIGKNEDEVTSWLSANGITNFKIYYRYQNAHNGGEVFYQSIGANTKLNADDYIYLKVSKGYINLDDFYDGIYNPDYNAKTFFDLQQWVYNQNKDGDAQMPSPIANYVDSAYPKDTILKFNVDDHYLVTGSTIHVDVSNGANAVATTDTTD